MAHRALVGGAGYDVIGGKPLVGGAGYKIAKGRTLVGGAGYDLPFKTPTFDEIMADMEVLGSGGRNSSSTGTLAAAYTNITESGTVYALQFIGGHIAITRADYEVVDSQTINLVSTDLLAATSAASITAIEAEYSGVAGLLVRARASYDGTTSDLRRDYGASLFVVRFPSYVPSQVDAAIRSVTFARLAGRNDSANGTVSSAYDATGRWLVATYNSGAYLAYSSPLGTVVFSNYTTNPSLLYQSGTTMLISVNGTSAFSSHGGSIVSVSG